MWFMYHEMGRNKLPAVLIYPPMLSHPLPFGRKGFSHTGTVIYQLLSDFFSPYTLHALIPGWGSSFFLHVHTLEKKSNISACFTFNSDHSPLYCNYSATRARTGSPSIKENITVIGGLWLSLQHNWSFSLGWKLQHPEQSILLLV